ncbi:MAG: sulfotransferase domain-containing protein [Ardenticatenaceae bacterium]|nr:sulfotransferase domain-containing protein [Anaerolineales bacterium]MCB8981229.1 sulfotransferase domain-containing protein [Ardenticatenaceae bacterium]
MSKIVWLASYPKSGNTWVRIFLNNYLQNGDAPADINNLEDSMHAGKRELFDRLTGVESSDLTAVEIDRFRPWMYGRWAEESSETLFVKVHDAYRYTDTGQPIFPQEATQTAVYIIRNPLDIVASMANHLSITLDKSIAYMADEQYALARSGSKLHRQLPQFMGSWHAHVHSWTDQTELPIHLVRYEDLLQAPHETFEKLVQAVGVPVAAERLAKAVAFSSFDQVKQQETAVGFKERLPETPAFFRHGQTGRWQTELSPAQIETICYHHQQTMQTFGYLDENGRPVIN